ncbi:hypothetical protein G5O_1013 [Chlamydia psittaci 6BC]|nr:hypothetical protein G5O_1013 [Chlamydia psittaci 6BC]
MQDSILEDHGDLKMLLYCLFSLFFKYIRNFA